jgi:hypothetical protein
MRKSLAFAGAAILAALSPVVHAEDAAFTARAGQMVVTSDGKRVGSIDRIAGQRVGIIRDTKYIYLPVASLSAGENGRVVTKLTYKEVNGL